MTGFLKFVWQKHRIVGYLAMAAVAVFLFFAVDFVGEALYFADPENRNRAVEPWMSIRYVEQSWGLTKPAMFDLIGYDPNTPPDEVPRSIGEHLAKTGETIAEFEVRLKQAQDAIASEAGK